MCLPPWLTNCNQTNWMGKGDRGRHRAREGAEEKRSKYFVVSDGIKVDCQDEQDG